MQYKIGITLLTSILFLSACAGIGSGIPDWVNGKSSAYPDTKYLTGKGQDTHQNVARDRARADLAKIFEVAITEKSHDEVSYKSNTLDQIKNTQLDTSNTRQITSHTDQIISGIEISETWQDKTSGQYHALATVDRAKMSTRLRSIINQLDDKTAQAIRQARQKSDPFDQLGLASIALQSQIEREPYQKQLQIVNYNGTGLNSPYDITTLLNDRNALLKRLKIHARLIQDPNNDTNSHGLAQSQIINLEKTIKGAVATAGFTDASNKDADYILNVDLKIDKNKDPQGWYWQKGLLEIVLQEQADNKILGSKQWLIKESSQDEKMSEKRVLDKINTLLQTELRETLIGFGSAN